jgi:SAM-dependent methyltransferase
MTPTTQPEQTSRENVTSTSTTEALAERLLNSTLGYLDLLSVYLGDRLGWYEYLRDHGPSTATELADGTATSRRYAREWLEQQAVTGFLDVVDVPTQRGGDAEEQAGRELEGAGRRYRLTQAGTEVLTDSTSLNYLGPVARLLAAPAMQLPALLDAYRTGGGVSWEQLGADAREGQAAMNRPWFEQSLAGALAAVPALHERLGRTAARLADIGCGAGWSSIALARAYPEARVEGFDIDAPSLDLARGHAAEAGVADRVSFAVADAARLPGDYDVVFAFECVHDMPRPVDVLAAVRRALAPGGVMVVMDEAVGEEFHAPGDPLERLMYGFSLFVCLPDGMSHSPSAGTGTLMRPTTLRRYAEAAGFSRVDVLPIEDFGFWRFYQLS